MDSPHPSESSRQTSDLSADATLAIAGDQAQVELTMLSLPAAVLAAEAAQAAADDGFGPFARYLHVRELGAGAMGTVALMQDVMLRRQVASKQIKPEALTSDEVVKQFLGEAQITAQLEHPGVVPVYSLEVGPEGQISYAMKVVEGQTLKDRLASLRAELADAPAPAWDLARRRLLEDFLKVLDAMAYAHDKGVIHRDLKPSNIMFGKFREVYLLDWGIACVFNSAAGVTAEVVANNEARPMTGTPRYMAPEQIKGRGMGPASDLFSLGLILQEIVTLQQAVQARSLPEAVRKILKPEERPIAHLMGHRIPPELRAIVARATTVKPADRYASVDELADELRRYLQDRETRVLPDKPWGKALRWVRHHSDQALMAATALLLLCAFAIGGSLWLHQQTIEATRRDRQVLEAALQQAISASQRLDGELGRYQSLLEHLAAAASEARQRGKADGPAAGQNLPQALAPFGPYQAPVAFSDISWTGSPAEAGRYTPLATTATSLFARAGDDKAVPRQWLGQQRPESPLAWALVELGKDRLLYPASFKAAELIPALTAGLGTEARPQPFWHLPLPQATDRPVGLLPLSIGIYDDQRAPLGRASLFLQTPAISASLSPDKIPGLNAYWLTDPSLAAIAGAQPEDLPSSVREAITRKQAGFYKTSELLYLYQPLATQDWYLVLAFEPQRLLEAR